MKKLTAAVLSAMIVISAPAFAMSHGGAKMDDKKVDCSKKEMQTRKSAKTRKRSNLFSGQQKPGKQVLPGFSLSSSMKLTISVERLL